MRTTPSSLRYRAMLAEVEARANGLFDWTHNPAPANPYPETDRRHAHFQRAVRRMQTGAWLIED